MKTEAKYNVTVKCWKTGESKGGYTNLTHAELVKVETEHHAHAPASWDMEITEVK